MTTLEFSITNEIDGSCKTAQCECAAFWDYMLQAAYIRLAHKKPRGGYHLEVLYEHRARRIAATYAQIYLETIEGVAGTGGTPALKGRFYWMGLGAFASKVVAGVFSDAVTKTGYAFGQGDSVHIFARGNLWLYMDIAPWHFMLMVEDYMEAVEKAIFDDPDESALAHAFDICKRQRSSDNFVTPLVKKTMENMPWSDECLAPMGKLKHTAEIGDAFDLIKQMGNNPFEERGLQYKHLMNIAVQEQRNILQKICWEHKDMIAGALAQREWRWLMPVRMIFHSDYSRTGNYQKQYGIADEDIVSEMPAHLHAEVYDQRMEWIVDVAGKYHKLMGNPHHRAYLENQLQIIAGWSNSGSLYNLGDWDSNDPE